MKFDLTQCNNLRWESTSASGFIKTDGENVCLFSDKKRFDTKTGKTENILELVLTAADLAKGEWENDFPNFHIVKRDPETYVDWKVGDEFIIPNDGDKLRFRVEAVIESIIGIRKIGVTDHETGIMYDLNYAIEFVHKTCPKQNHAKLDPTPYEKSIPDDGNKTDRSFMKGDKVKVRQNDNDDWIEGVFARYEDGDRPYFVVCTNLEKSGNYAQCIIRYDSKYTNFR